MFKKTIDLLIEKLRNHKSDTALIIALEGDLGTGKTTLTKQLSKELGIKETVTSPTFVLLKEYKINTYGFTKLIHIDAYRMKSSLELLALDFEKLKKDKDNIIIIEWANLVQDILPNSIIKLRLKHGKNGTREIYID